MINNNGEHSSPQYLAHGPARDAVFIVDHEGAVSGLVFTIIKHDDHKICYYLMLRETLNSLFTRN